jgi:hypothetical protein
METLLTSARNLAQTARFRRLLSAFTLAGAGATAPLVIARKATVAIPADGAHRSTGRAARTATATALAGWRSRFIGVESGRMASWSDVRRIALALPGTSEQSSSGGNSAWVVNNKFFA